LVAGGTKGIAGVSYTANCAEDDDQYTVRLGSRASGRGAHRVGLPSIVSIG
jgi:hypothetical protein